MPGRPYNRAGRASLRRGFGRTDQAANTTRHHMSDRREFGPWTLVAIIGWITGIILACVAIWRLWAGWYQM